VEGRQFNKKKNTSFQYINHRFKLALLESPRSVISDQQKFAISLIVDHKALKTVMILLTDCQDMVCSLLSPKAIKYNYYKNQHLETCITIKSLKKTVEVQLINYKDCLRV
jgi:hypothetical protein